MSNDLLTADELAKHLKVQPSTVRRWQREGRIPAVRVTAKVVRFDYAAVVDAIRRAEQTRDLLSTAKRRGLHLTTADKLESHKRDGGVKE